MSLYPNALIWGRIGREEHMRRIERELFEEFCSMYVPPNLAHDLAARAAAIYGSWDPFVHTWFADWEYDDATTLP